MKKSFSLFEIILTIIVGSFTIVYGSIFSKQSYEKSINDEKIAIAKIDLNSTKIFLQNNISYIPEKLKYNNKTLYFDNSILLTNLEAFELIKKSNRVEIKINYNNQIIQNWVLKL